MSNEREYKEIYDKYTEYEKSVHLANQKRIRVGLKVNILLPLVFLILSFAIKSAKLVFLIMWIITLFGIAGYLIFVEYTDYKIVERMKEFGMLDKDELEDRALIGENIQQAETVITEKLDAADERIEEEKQRIAKEIEERKNRLLELTKKKTDEQEEENHEEHH